MSERTAITLASLSHQWSMPILGIMVTLGALAWGSRKLLDHVDRNDARYGFVARSWFVSLGLFSASIVLASVSLLHIGCAYLVGHGNDCRKNVKQLSLAMLMYVQDNDDHFPPSERWTELTEHYARGSQPSTVGDANAFKCPSAQSKFSYGMNAAMGRLSLSNIASQAETPMIFDAEAPNRSFAGGIDQVSKTRHNGMPNIGFTDGHVTSRNVNVIGKLKWSP